MSWLTNIFQDGNMTLSMDNFPILFGLLYAVTVALLMLQIVEEKAKVNFVVFFYIFEYFISIINEILESLKISQFQK